MPRKNAYVCQLTPTHVKWIENVLAVIVKCELQTERREAARGIVLILHSPAARRSIKVPC